jgi:hypothetical protein
MRNLNKLLQVLLENKIDFVLIGGFAAATYGVTQLTQDVDICARLDDINLEKIRGALRPYHPKHRMNPSFMPSLDEVPRPGEQYNNIYLTTDLGILDILSSASPAGTFDEISSRAVSVQLFRHECKIISIDDLIKIKESMKRPKDRLVLQELLMIRDKK